MMLAAIEMSTSRGSAAILQDGAVRARRTWEGSGGTAAVRCFEGLAGAAQAAGVGWDAVGVFVIGRGPGNYTGLRLAAATASALALPGGARAAGLSSAEVLAEEIAAETGRKRVMVIGDARRGRLWWGLRDEGQLFTCALTDVDKLPALAPADAAVVSPDAGRLDGLLLRLRTPRRLVLADPRVPSAEAVGRLAQERLRRGMALDPATPLYLHPAVAQGNP